MKHNVTPPYLGVAYYPEDWDASEISYDISMMKQAGIDAISKKTEDDQNIVYTVVIPKRSKNSAFFFSLVFDTEGSVL